MLCWQFYWVMGWNPRWHEKTFRKAGFTAGQTGLLNAIFGVRVFICRQHRGGKGSWTKMWDLYNCHLEWDLWSRAKRIYNGERIGTKRLCRSLLNNLNEKWGGSSWREWQWEYKTRNRVTKLWELWILTWVSGWIVMLLLN